MATLDRLKTVIDAYGGNPERWPAPERAGLVALATATPEIADLLAEARALDAVLRTAPDGDTSRIAALHERILAEAGASERAGSASRDRVALLPRRQARSASPRTPLWVAAALAASLFAGVALGASELGRPAVEGLAGLAGFETVGGALDTLDDTEVELL